MSALSSIETELSQLETEERGLKKQLAELEKRQKPLERVSDDAKAFIRNWGDVGEILDAATDEEKTRLIRHYVEVVELHATDAKGKTGTYAMRLFQEVCPDRGFDWGVAGPETLQIDGNPCPETTNGPATQVDCVPVSLTDSRLVCIPDEKAPPTQPSS